MSRWLEAVKRANGAETMEPPQLRNHTALSVLSVLSEGVTPKPEKVEREDPEHFPHGVSVTGSPKTWTGRVVPVDDWRNLTEWEKHGPNGRHWNGITQNWEPPDNN